MGLSPTNDRSTAQRICRNRQAVGSGLALPLNRRVLLALRALEATKMFLTSSRRSRSPYHKIPSRPNERIILPWQSLRCSTGVDVASNLRREGRSTLSTFGGSCVARRRGSFSVSSPAGPALACCYTHYGLCLVTGVAFGTARRAYAYGEYRFEKTEDADARISGGFG